MIYNTIKNKLYKTGKQIWRHGLIISWHPNNTPERWLLGPCPECGSTTSNYGGAYSCTERYCKNSANVFVSSPEKTPDWWNSNINVKLDGDSWCAHDDDFIDLQESVAGFGDTPREAVDDFRANPNKTK